MGSIYKRGNKLWIAYYRDGRKYRESTGSARESDAKRLLRLREGDIERGVPVTPKIGRLRFTEAAEDLINDYKVNGKRSLDHAQRRIDLHLTPVFGHRRMAGITTADIRSFISARLDAQASPGEINRELALLKRMYTLAIQAGSCSPGPTSRCWRRTTSARGSLTASSSTALISHLPDALRPMVTFAYITGWRIPSEVLTLQWRQVDLDAGTVRLDPGTTKIRRGASDPPDGRTCGRCWNRSGRSRMPISESARRSARGCSTGNGERIKTFRTAWQTACRLAGCPGRIPHDLRRTAVRNFVRAGVSEHVAMKLSGHKTASVFRAVRHRVGLGSR